MTCRHGVTLAWGLILCACGGHSETQGRMGSATGGTSAAGETSFLPGGGSAAGGGTGASGGGDSVTDAGSGGPSTSAAILNPNNCPGEPSAELSQCTVTISDVNCNMDNECEHLVLPSCTCTRQDVSVNNGSAVTCMALVCDNGPPVCAPADQMFQTQDCIKGPGHSAHCVHGRCMSYATD
ncbi:MAG TPA: hypothetical protein VIK01_01710 [Polyangiaceae bacterium]